MSSASVPSLSQIPRSADADTNYTTGDDIAYAMSHPVNVRAHGTVAGTSTMNPYLLQNVVLDEDSLQNDVRYFIEL